MRLHCGEHRSRGQGNEPSFVSTLGEKSGGSVADGAILEVRGVAWIVGQKVVCGFGFVGTEVGGESFSIR